MKKLLIVVILAQIIVLFSCKSELQKQSLKQIDKMLNKIEVLEEELTKDEVRNYQILYDTIRKYNNLFLYLPEEAAESSKNLEIIYHYGEVEKVFKKLHTYYLVPYLNDLNTSKNQLKALKEDINNNLLEDDEIHRYLHSEDSAIYSLEIIIFDKLDFAKENYKKYQKYHPKVIDLLEKYEQVL